MKLIYDRKNNIAFKCSLIYVGEKLAFYAGLTTNGKKCIISCARIEGAVSMSNTKEHEYTIHGYVDGIVKMTNDNSFKWLFEGNSEFVCLKNIDAYNGIYKKELVEIAGQLNDTSKTFVRVSSGLEVSNKRAFPTIHNGKKGFIHDNVFYLEKESFVDLLIEENYFQEFFK